MTATFQDTVDTFITGVGRLVQGTPYEKQTKDFATGQTLPENKQKYYVGIAFDKTQDAITKFTTIWALMQQAAATHPAAAMFAKANWAGFKFKFEDGDDPKNADKPGWKNHYILKFSNGYAPQILDENQNDVSQQPDALYRGCYVRIVGSVKQNGAQGAQAGIYMNFNCIQRVAHGERIQTGPDVRSLLGAAAIGALPPGASSIPQSPAGTPGLPVAGAPAAPAGLPGVPAGAPAPVATPGMPPVSAPAPAPVDKQSLMNNGLDYQAHIAAGWTDEMLVSNGMMRAPAPVAAPVAASAPVAPPVSAPPVATPGAPVGQPIGQLPPGVPAGVPSTPGLPGMPHTYAQ